MVKHGTSLGKSLGEIMAKSCKSSCISDCEPVFSIAITRGWIKRENKKRNKTQLMTYFFKHECNLSPLRPAHLYDDKSAVKLGRTVVFWGIKEQNLKCVGPGFSGGDRWLVKLCFVHSFYRNEPCIYTRVSTSWCALLKHRMTTCSKHVTNIVVFLVKGC